MPSFREIRITRQVSNQLKKLIALHERIPEIIAAAMVCTTASGLVAFSKHVAKKANVSTEDSISVLSSLLNLRLGQKTMECQSSTEFIDHLNHSLRSLTNSLRWNEESLQQWEFARPTIVAALEQLSGDSSLMLSSKAQFLTYKRERIFTNAKIISDIRPVFNTEATEIKEMIVTHSLVIEYRDDDSEKTIHITLDASDIAKLQEECQRAHAKADVIVNELSALPWRTVILPETSMERDVQ